MKILVAGVSVRYIACSAARAGHSVVALDCYNDLDLERSVFKSERLSFSELQRSLDLCIQEYSPEALVLGTGLEDLDIKSIRVLNNPPKKINHVSDKLWMARWLEKKGFPFIPTFEFEDSVQLPAIVKPRRGAGGIGCHLLQNMDDLRSKECMIVQPMVKGRPASASVIANGNEAKAIAVNEQIIGAKWVGAKDFIYCGNITPLEPDCPEIAEIAKDIVTELGLVGSNGVDFVLTKEGPVVVEVNPRFQGSLDTVELSTGINIFQAHLQAFEGVIPDIPVPRNCAGKAIIYARKDLIAEGDLNREWIKDIPRQGTGVKKGRPFCSILAAGMKRENVLNELKKKALVLYE